MYDTADHIISAMFDTPPSNDAQIEVRFSYNGLRVCLDYAGNVEITDVKQSIDES